MTATPTQYLVEWRINPLQQWYVADPLLQLNSASRAIEHAVDTLDRLAQKNPQRLYLAVRVFDRTARGVIFFAERIRT